MWLKNSKISNLFFGIGVVLYMVRQEFGELYAPLCGNFFLKAFHLYHKNNEKNLITDSSNQFVMELQ